MNAVPIVVEHVEALLAIAGTATERELLSAAASSIATLLGDRAYCALLDGTPRVVVSTMAPSLIDWPINLVRYPEISAAIERKAPVAIEDVTEHPLLEAVRASLPRSLRSVAVVPMLVGDRCTGVLVAQSRTLRQFSPEALHTAALVAKLAAQLLPTARRDDQFPGLPIRTSMPMTPRDGLPAVTKPERARRVLVVDDDIALAEDLAEILRDEKHYEVWTACDGPTGLQEAKTRRPDLILLDVVMPMMDGFDTAKQLAADVATRDIPILFLSGVDDLTTRIRDVTSRTADFLSKPFSRAELIARVERSMQHLALRERLQQAAYTDDLTGLGNLRLFRERLALEEARSERYGTSLAVLVIDVDRLKKINDEHGHTAGSEALKAVAKVLRGGAREMDVAARYGGDEFVVLLPHATANDGNVYAQRVLEKLRTLRPAGITVSMSIGIAATVGGRDRSLINLLEKADAAVYRAKRLGGDRACIDESTGAQITFAKEKRAGG